MGEVLCMIVLVAIVVIAIRTVFDGRSRSVRLGDAGEEKVSIYLGQLDSHRYRVFNDVMVRTKAGVTTQIDHVVVSQYGVYVVETKNISGWVFASARSSEWTSTLPVIRRGWFGPSCYKYHFQNPLRQNYLHVATLAWRLKIPESSFFNFVAFPDETEFKKGYPAGVYRYSELVSAIQSNKNKMFDVKLTRSLANEIAAVDSAITPEERAAHVMNLHCTHKCINGDGRYRAH